MFYAKLKGICKAIVNGCHYEAKNTVMIKKDQVVIDGEVQCQIIGHVVNVEIHGYCSSIQNTAGDITVQGNAKNIDTVSGNVLINGNVDGNIETVSGDIKCDSVGGSIETLSGDINHA